MKNIEKILRETDAQFEESTLALTIEGREQAVASALLNAKRDHVDAKKNEKEALRSFVKGDDDAFEEWINARSEIASIEKLITEIEAMKALLSEEVKA